MKSSGSLLRLIWRDNANMSNVKGGIPLYPSILAIMDKSSSPKA